MTEHRATEPVGVGVVGLGFGATHVAAFRSDSRCEVVALCGTQLERARDSARKLEIPSAFSNVQDLLRHERLDAVSLAVPAPVQVEIAKAAFRAGKHVFLEKPLGPTLSASLPLSGLAGKQVTAINFEFPELEAFRSARRLLREGRLGELRHVAATWRIETYANKHDLDDSWKTNSAGGGGALNLFGSHAIYYLTWFLGPIGGVWATLSHAPSDKRCGETHVTSSLSTTSGLPITLSITTDSYLGPGHRIEFYGRGGTLVLENTGSDYVAGFRLLLADRSSGAFQEVPTQTVGHGGPADGRIAATASVVRRFIDAIRSGEPRVTPGLSEGLEVQKVLDAMRRSDETGRLVDVGSMDTNPSD